MFEQYFSGKSYLNPLTKPGESPIFLFNLTFEPGCRNDWHIHHADKGGGQMLICTEDGIRLRARLRKALCRAAL